MIDVISIILFQKRQQEGKSRRFCVGSVGVGHQAGWETLVCAVVVLHGQPELLEVVGALDAIGGLAHPLHGRNQQADEDGDDANDNQQFDESKATPHRGTPMRVFHARIS